MITLGDWSAEPGAASNNSTNIKVMKTKNKLVHPSMTRRSQVRNIFSALGAALIAPSSFLPSEARAQSRFPSRPVRLIVPFPPGQATDVFARMLAEKLAPVWGQNVVVENKGGGGGVPAMEALRVAPADGYTLAMGTSGTIGINPVVYSKLPYDVAKDFAMVTKRLSLRRSCWLFTRAWASTRWSN